MNNGFLIWNRSYREGFCVITKLEGFKEQWLLAKGISLADKWPDNVTYRMSPMYPKDINLSDNLFGGNYRVISSRLKEALLPLAGKSNIEFLPVSILNHKGRVASNGYFILNPLDIVDCIDVEQSGVVWNSIDPTLISNCEKFVLKEETVPNGLVVFRPKFMSGTILIRKEVADKITTENFTGISFLESSKYTG